MFITQGECPLIAATGTVEVTMLYQLETSSSHKLKVKIPFIPPRMECAES